MPKTGDKNVIAVCCSDIHFSHKPPLARAERHEGWYAAMDWVCTQLRRLCLKHGCPLVIAGDVFHTYKQPPELVNRIMGSLPEVTYAVPGQHDLPHHEYKSIHKSSYWTLCEARKIRNLDPNSSLGYSSYRVLLFGFPWGTPLTPLEEDRKAVNLAMKCIHIAVVHKYVCTKKTAHPGAGEESHASKLVSSLSGFDVAITGDNHCAFEYQGKKGVKIFNCGCLIRRRSDERGYQPSVGLLYDDGTIERHPLDCSDDKWHEPEKIIHESGLPEQYRKDFLKELNKMGSDPLDFKEAVLRVLDNCKMTSEGQRRLILESLDMEGY